MVVLSHKRMPKREFIKRLTTEVLPGFIVGVLGSALLFKDWLVVGGSDRFLWANDLDPGLMNWIASWGYHILFERADPLNFWNANSFYPNTLSLAYSDSLLTLQAFYAPLRWLGLPSITALYGALIATSIACATLTYQALRKLQWITGIEAGFITYGAHFSLSMTAFLYHYQLFGFQLASPLLIYLYLYLTSYRLRYLVAVCLLFIAGVCFAGYFAPMVVSVALFGGTFLFWHQYRRNGLLNIVTNIGWQSVVTVVACAAVLYAIQLWPYFLLRNEAPHAPLDQVVRMSAGLTTLFTGTSDFSLWYRPNDYEWGRWERSYFPGIILLISGGMFAIVLGLDILSRFRKSSKRLCEPGCMISLGLEKANERQQSIYLFGRYMFVIFVASVVLSLGPLLKPVPSIKLPYYFLSFVIPGLESVRAPGRFGILIGLPLAACLVVATRVWLPSRTRAFVLPILLILLVIESIPRIAIFPFEVDANGVHQRIGRAIPEGTPLLILPVAGRDALQSTRYAIEQLNGSTLHWAKLVAGYGAWNSPQFEKLLEIDRTVQGNGKSPQLMFDFAQQYRIQYIFIYMNRYTHDVVERWNKVLQDNRTQIIDETSEGVLIKIY